VGRVSVCVCVCVCVCVLRDRGVIGVCACTQCALLAHSNRLPLPRHSRSLQRDQVHIRSRMAPVQCARALLHIFKVESRCSSDCRLRGDCVHCLERARTGRLVGWGVEVTLLPRAVRSRSRLDDNWG
jgi:hypothetical protein